MIGPGYSTSIADPSGRSSNRYMSAGPTRTARCPLVRARAEIAVEIASLQDRNVDTPIRVVSSTIMAPRRVYGDSLFKMSSYGRENERSARTITRSGDTDGGIRTHACTETYTQTDTHVHTGQGWQRRRGVVDDWSWSASIRRSMAARALFCVYIERERERRRWRRIDCQALGPRAFDRSALWSVEVAARCFARSMAHLTSKGGARESRRFLRITNFSSFRTGCSSRLSDPGLR